MPIYEYEYEKCLLRFELKRHFGEVGASPCPQCGYIARRLF
jgi:putative FmdB family regulatory protein